jgi:pyridoxamine 5'-phosphate oxidase
MHPAEAAPWRADFLEHIGKMSQATFAFASLHPAPADEQTAGPAIPVVPRVRTCIYRGLWAALPKNDKNKAPMNPEGRFTSDLLTFTTDARMDKTAEIVDTAPGTELGLGGASESGGGGPVEAMFWVEETGTQWRFRGTAWVIGRDIDEDAGKPVRDKVLARMRALDSAKGDWSFGRELAAQFGNLSPGMRGSFRQPPSGASRSIPPEEGYGLGQKVDTIDDEIARKHFRVVIILPTQVDRVDLSDGAKPWRRLYSYKTGQAQEVTEAGSWEVEELWP